MTLHEKTARKAAELGFTGFGVCSADPFDDWKQANETRHAQGHGRLIPLRSDPKEVLPDARAILVFSWPYYPFGEPPEGCVFVPAYYFANTKADRALEELAEYLKLLMSQYDERTFEVGKNLDTDTKFMGNKNKCLHKL